MHRAAHHGRADSLKGLAASGADIECPRISYRTAVLDVIAYHHLPMVKALLESVADLHAVDSDGLTVLHLVVGFGSMKIIRELSKQYLVRVPPLLGRARVQAWGRLPGTSE